MLSFFFRGITFDTKFCALKSFFRHRYWYRIYSIRHNHCLAFILFLNFKGLYHVSFLIQTLFWLMLAIISSYIISLQHTVQISFQYLIGLSWICMERWTLPIKLCLHLVGFIFTLRTILSMLFIWNSSILPLWVT